MAIEKTLSIIKPDAVAKNVIGKIIARFEENGLRLVAGKLIQLNDEKASGFYFRTLQIWSWIKIS